MFAAMAISAFLVTVNILVHYEVLRLSLPKNVVPAYDGMRLTLGQTG